MSGHITIACPVRSGTVDRIAIIGCGGSGKTTIGRRLAAVIDAPITHLDTLFYDDEWNRLPQDKFAAVQEELVAQPTWVIDGNYASTLPIRLKRADTVIFLDLPATVCLWGIVQRRWRYRGGQHDATGVYDRITWGFIKYVWGYRNDMGPKIRNLIAEHADHAQVHIVTSRRTANRLVAQLEQAAVQQ